MALFDCKKRAALRPQALLCLPYEVSDAVNNFLHTYLDDFTLNADFSLLEDLWPLQMRNSLITLGIQLPGRPYVQTYPARHALLRIALSHLDFDCTGGEAELERAVGACAYAYEYSASSTLNEPLLLINIVTPDDVADLEAYYKRNLRGNEVFLQHFCYFYQLYLLTEDAAYYGPDLHIRIAHYSAFFDVNNAGSFVLRCDAHFYRSYLAAHVLAAVYSRFASEPNIQASDPITGSQISECTYSIDAYHEAETYYRDVASPDANLLFKLIEELNSSKVIVGAEYSILSYLKSINEKAAYYEAPIKEAFETGERSPSRMMQKLRQMMREDSNSLYAPELQKLYDFKYDGNAIALFEQYSLHEYAGIDSARAIPNLFVVAQGANGYTLNPSVYCQIADSQAYFATRAFYFLIYLSYAHLAFMVHCDLRRLYSFYEQNAIASLLSDQMLCLQQVRLYYISQNIDLPRALFYDYFFNDKVLQKLYCRGFPLNFSSAYDLASLVERQILRTQDAFEALIYSPACDVFMRDRARLVYYEYAIFNLLTLTQVYLNLAAPLKNIRYLLETIRYALNGPCVWGVCYRLAAQHCNITPFGPLDALLLLLQAAIIKISADMNPLNELTNSIYLCEKIGLYKLENYLLNARARHIVRLYADNIQTNYKLCSKFVNKELRPRTFHYLAHDMIAYNARGGSVTKIFNFAESTYDSQVDRHMLAIVYHDLQKLCEYQLYFKLEFMPQKNIVTYNKLFQNSYQQFCSFTVDDARYPACIALNDAINNRDLYNHIVQSKIHAAIEGKVFKNLQIANHEYSLRYFYLLHIAYTLDSVSEEIPSDRLQSYYYDLLIFKEIRLNSLYQSECLRLRKLFSGIFLNGYQQVLQTRIYRDESFYIFVSIFNPNICDVEVVSVMPQCELSTIITVEALDAPKIPAGAAAIILLRCRLSDYSIGKFTITGYRIQFYPVLLQQQLYMDAPLHNPNEVRVSPRHPLAIKITADKYEDEVFEHELILLSATFTTDIDAEVTVMFKTSNQEDMIILDPGVERLPFCSLEHKAIPSLEDITFSFQLLHSKCIRFRIRATSSCRFVIYTMHYGLCQAFQYSYRIKANKQQLIIKKAQPCDTFYKDALTHGAKLLSQLPGLSEDVIWRFWSGARAYSQLAQMQNVCEVGIPYGCVIQNKEFLFYYYFAPERVFTMKQINMQQRLFAYYQSILRSRQARSHAVYALYEVESGRFVLNYHDFQ